MKYRKRPVVIEAVYYDGSDESYAAACGLATGQYLEPLSNRQLLIHTLEGTMTCSPGDWLIKGVAGELYPCKAAIFDQTYEAAGGDAD